jgi:hypothetical protein
MTVSCSKVQQWEAAEPRHQMHSSNRALRM